MMVPKGKPCLNRNCEQVIERVYVGACMGPGEGHTQAFGGKEAWGKMKNRADFSGSSMGGGGRNLFSLCIKSAEPKE